MHMNAVGIDISKGKSMVAAMRPLGELLVKPYEVIHTAGELEKLAFSLKKLGGETRVIMECTGRYHEAVAGALNEAGIFVSTVNPILIHGYGNNSVRRAKTDRKDAMKIAKYGLDNWADLREYTPMDAVRQNLKTFSRQYNLYIKTKTALKNNLVALLDQSFPGANNLFDSPARADGHQKWVDFVMEFWHCKCVAGLSEKVFTERYRKWCKKNSYNFSENRAADIYAAAAGHFVTIPKNEHTKLLITGAAAQLTAVSVTVEVFRAEMLRLAQSLPEFPVVMAMYGVGNTLGPQIMAEIGDVRRFERKQSLVAFAGVDPEPNQSGTHNPSSRPASKRGSPALRKSLFLVMSALLRTAPDGDPVYQFIDKKRAEGKPYYVYMTAGATKFLRVYYGRVKEYLNSLEDNRDT
jgi:transposase